ALGLETPFRGLGQGELQCLERFFAIGGFFGGFAFDRGDLKHRNRVGKKFVFVLAKPSLDLRNRWVGHECGNSTGQWNVVRTSKSQIRCDSAMWHPCQISDSRLHAASGVPHRPERSDAAAGLEDLSAGHRSRRETRSQVLSRRWS